MNDTRVTEFRARIVARLAEIQGEEALGRGGQGNSTRRPSVG